MKFNLLVVIASLSVATAQQNQPHRALKQILSYNVAHYAVHAANLLQAVAQLGSDFDVPLGVEWQGNPRIAREIVHQWNNVTVERILLDMAGFDVEYQVEISNDVVHIRKAALASDSRNP